MPVWLHWVSPTGRVRQTAALGTTGGDCGTLTTAPRRVFPFDAEAGRWVLVLDTSRRYRVQTPGPRAKIPVHVRSILILMRRFLLVTLLTAAAALALALVPAAIGASKAKIVLDPGCFLSSGSGLLTGSGFRPNSAWTAKLAGTKQIGTGRIDARGKIRARFTAPRYHGTAGTREMTLSVTDGPHVASTTFLMSPLSAGFSPRTGDPAGAARALARARAGRSTTASTCTTSSRTAS